jgi:ribosomal-protein-alanine N-acetyltransferase
MMTMVRLRLRPRQGGNRLQKRIFSGWLQWLWKSRLQGPDWAKAGDRLGQSADPHTIAAVAALIRQFKREDFDALWRMDQECFAPGIAYSKQELRSFMSHRAAFTLVASEDDMPQGFIVALNGAVGHVITIVVSPMARRSGIGSLLLGAAEQQLAVNGSKAVGLETAVDNVAALSFYKRHGYSVLRTWPRYYSNGVDALVLRKPLPEKS